MEASKIIGMYETSYNLKKCRLSISHIHYFTVFINLDFSELLFHFPPCKLKPLN